MNTEIKFRGLRKDGKGWVFGSFIHNSIDCPCIIDNDAEQYEVIPETVGQLLHVEKNGREWYKGDIAKMTAEKNIHYASDWEERDVIHNTYTGVVTMHPNNGLCIKITEVFDHIEGECIIFDKNLHKTIAFYRAEIIGNIHEEEVSNAK